MKKIILMLVAAIALTIGTAVLAEPFVVQAAAAKLNKTEISMDVGEKIKLKVKNNKKKVKWKSDNSKVARVSKKGNVYALSHGECTITAKVGKKTFTCKVTVKDTALELLDSAVTINEVRLPISSVWEYSGAVQTQIYQYSLGSDVFKWVCAEVADLQEAEMEMINSSEENFMNACSIVVDSFKKDFNTEDAVMEIISTDDGYLGRVAGTCVSNKNDVSVIIYIRVLENKVVVVMGMEIDETDPYTERIVKTICTEARVSE